MKKLLLSTILVASTAGFAMAQDPAAPATGGAPATDTDTQAPLTGEGMTPAAESGTTTPDTAPAPDGAVTPVTPEATTPDATTAPATTAEASTSREGFSPMMTEALTSENLTGANVYSSEDEDIGSVSELVLDDAGQITQVIVDVGGFLGIGAKPVALTLDELELLQETDGDEIRAYAPMTKEEIEALPEYTAE